MPQDREFSPWFTYGNAYAEDYFQNSKSRVTTTYDHATAIRAVFHRLLSIDPLDERPYDKNKHKM